MAVRPICVEQRLQRLARNRLKLENPSVIVTTRSFGNPWGEIRTVSYATYSKRYRMIKLTVIDTHSDCCFCFSNCSRRCRTFSLSRCALCKQFISTLIRLKECNDDPKSFRCSRCTSWPRSLENVALSWSLASPAMGHWGTCSPRLSTISFLVHFGVNLRANYPRIV